MIRLLLLGLVAVASTLGGGYIGSMLSANSGGHTATESAKTDVVRLEPSSVPIIRHGKLTGYVVARAAVTADAEEVKNNKLVLSLYAAEAVFKAVFEEESFDFTALRPGQIASLNEIIVRTANERMGRTVLKHSILENLSFVTPDEVRCSN